MSNSTLASLCEDVHSGKISEKKAINDLYAYIYNNKPLFGLQLLDDDEFNDFMLYIYENIKRTFYSFNIQKSSFMTYIQNTIRLNIKSWTRINNRLDTIQSYAIKFSKDTYAEYNQEPLFSSEQYDDYNASEECNIAMSNIQLLAVALKSSYFLTPQHITALSSKTGYSEEYIWKLKKNIDEHMHEKYLKNEDRIQKINKSYFFRQRALNALSVLNKNHPRYPKLYRIFLFHDTHWKKRRESVQYRSILPVNSYIAEILHVPESLVIKAITKAKKIITDSSKNH